jgi:hypothetical protein
VTRTVPSPYALASSATTRICSLVKSPSGMLAIAWTKPNCFCGRVFVSFQRA